MKWSQILPAEACQIAQNLEYRAQQERLQGAKICPPQNQIFRALNLTPPELTKVVIVGQDPYHTPGVANGLAFSTNPGTGIPPSLRNIYKELSSDIGCKIPTTSDLTSWTEQGVLLINSSLTVYEHQANSHSNWGWQKFTKAILSAAAELSQPIVFLLWGAFAQDLKDNILKSLSVFKPNGIILQPKINKGIIMSSHPSPLSSMKQCRDTPAFIGSKPFSKANELLILMGGTPVDWSLE